MKTSDTLPAASHRLHSTHLRATTLHARPQRSPPHQAKRMHVSVLLRCLLQLTSTCYLYCNKSLGDCASCYIRANSLWKLASDKEWYNSFKQSMIGAGLEKPKSPFPPLIAEHLHRQNLLSRSEELSKCTCKIGGSGRDLSSSRLNRVTIRLRSMIHE